MHMQGATFRLDVLHDKSLLYWDFERNLCGLLYEPGPLPSMGRCAFNKPIVPLILGLHIIALYILY
jgi:hypothetical protein